MSGTDVEVVAVALITEEEFGIGKIPILRHPKSTAKAILTRIELTVAAIRAGLISAHLTKISLSKSNER
jgi:hypothetical protein